MSEPRATYRVRRRRPKISQREAHRLRRRVVALESLEAERTRRYSTQYPGGVHLLWIDGLHDFKDGQLDAAVKMGAALVGRWDEHAKRLQIYAVLP